MGDRAALQRAITARVGGADMRPVFVAALGIDRFSRVRSVLGDEVAEHLVDQLTLRLRGLSADLDLGRLGLETVGIAFSAGSLREAIAKAEAARSLAGGVYAFGEHRIDVRVTGGLSLGGPPAALMQEAELALEAARTARRPAAIFDAGAHAAAAQEFSLMPELRQAIADNTLHLEHQPKFDLRRATFSGVESLVRWIHPSLGRLAPDLFVAMAEETGDIQALTKWVLEQVIAEQAALYACGHRLTFAVNLSGRLVGDRAAVDALLELAAGAQAPLVFEVTETAVIADPEAGISNLERIADAGHGVSIDDYGSGLSSLAYLKQMPANELKLDRSLLQGVTRGRRDALLIRSTIDLAHALGMKVVAEGVEDDATLALLASMGCDVVQGWRVSRPLPFARLRDFLDSHTAETARGEVVWGLDGPIGLQAQA